MSGDDARTCGDIDGKPCEWLEDGKLCSALEVFDRTIAVPPNLSVCPPVAAMLECRRHLHACQLTVTSLHNLLGTDSASDLEAEIRELMRCRQERDEAKAKCDTLNAGWKPGQPVPHLCEVASMRVQELKFRIAELEAERDRLQARVDMLEMAEEGDYLPLLYNLKDTEKARDRLLEWVAKQPCENSRLAGGYPVSPENEKDPCGKCVPCQARAALNGGDDEALHMPKPESKRYRLVLKDGGDDDQA
jgi:hypothetical protein